MLAVMNVTRRWPVVFNPIRSRPKFSKYLPGPKLLRRPVVMMIDQNPAEDADDRRVALIAVESDMACGSGLLTAFSWR